MRSTPDDRFAAVIATIEPHATVVRTWQFSGGLSSEMTAIEVELPHGIRRRFVVRARGPEKKPSIASEFQLLVVLRALGLRTQQPLRLDETLTVLDRPYCVLDYVDAAARMDVPDPIATAHGFAAELAAIHQIDGCRPEFAALPRRADVIAAQLAAPAAELDASLREADIRAALGAHWPPTPAERPSLLHGDFWPGNVLWAGDEIVAVIDWEDACVGDPLADVGTTRLDLLWAFGPRAMATFTTHYAALTAADLTTLPVWDLVATLRPAGEISMWGADWDAFGRPDVTASTMRATHNWFLDEALVAAEAMSRES